MEGLAWWALAAIYLSVAAAGVAMGYGIYQWRQARKEETPRQKAEREQATRRAFRSSGHADEKR